MKLVIEIDCDHSAQIQCRPKGLGNLLRSVAKKLDDYERNQPVEGRIIDENGRQVGTYKRA